MTDATQNCVYCGLTEAVEVDHIPPSALFAKPRPSNLIAVPACSTCNRGASKDDEYFKIALMMKHDTYSHPDVRASLPSVFRAFQKPKKVRFARAFIEKMREYELRTPAGIVAGTVVGFDVDLERFGRVAQRIARGLYYHELHTPLAPSANVAAWFEDGLREFDAEMASELERTILRPLASAKSRTIGANVFTYRFSVDKHHPQASAWLLEFYRRVRCLCLTVPAERGA